MMKDNQPYALLNKPLFSVTSGKFLSNVVSFILGGAVALGALVGSIGYIVSTVTIKDGIQLAESITKSEINYSEYVTEDYAKKTVWEALDGIYDLTQSTDSLSLDTFKSVSPAGAGAAIIICEKLEEFTGVHIDPQTLVTTPFTGMVDFVTTSALDTPVTTLFEKLGSEVKPNGVTDAIFYYETETGEKQARTIKMLMDTIAAGNATGLIGEVPLSALMNVDATSDKILIALAYGNECKKDEEGNYVNAENGYEDEEASATAGKTVYTGDYIIEDGVIKPVPADRKLNTVKNLLDDETMLKSLRISDVMGTNTNSPLMSAISSWQIKDLDDPAKIEELHIRDILDTKDVTEESSPILYTLKDLTIGDLKNQDKINEKIMSVKIKSIFATNTTDENGNTVTTYPSGLLGEICEKDWTLENLKDEEKIKELSLRSIFGSDMESNFILKHLTSSSLGSLAGDLEGMTIVDLFEKDIHYDAKGNVTGTWKYLLNNGPKKPEKYTIQDFNQLVSNMQTNMQNATLNELKADGIMDLDAATLSKDITIGAYAGKGKKIGDLTVSQLIDYVSELTT